VIYHKFHARQTEYNGRTFHSKKEAKRAQELDWLIRGGEVVFYLRQPMFDLPGGVTYKADFAIYWTDGHVSFEDVKGYRTKDFVMKKKMVESQYPISIEEA